MIQIFLKTLTGRTIALDVAEIDSILTLKQIIQNYEGVPPAQQRLTCNGKKLEDAMTISTCNLNTGSTIQLLLNLHGPADSFPPSVAILCAENLISTLPATNLHQLSLTNNDLMNFHAMVCQEFLDDLNSPFLLIFHHDPQTDPSLATTDMVIHRKSAGEYLSCGMITILEENVVISIKAISGPANYYHEEGIVEDYLVPVIPPTQKWKPNTNYVVRLSHAKNRKSPVGEWMFRSPSCRTNTNIFDPSVESSLGEPPLRSLCIVCLENTRNAVFVHGKTGHTCCCLVCAEDLQKMGMACPLCREPIDLVIQNFH